MISRIFRTLALIVDILAVAALVATGYAGMLSPLTSGALWGVLPLAFPIAFWVVVVLLVIQLFWHRRGAIVCGLGLLVCAQPCLDYFPLHITTPKAPDGATTFKLLSYNTHQFTSPEDEREGIKPDTAQLNPQMQLILDTDADIVCLQEATYFNRPYFSKIVGPSQMAALHSLYPHVIVTAEELVFLSKFPVEAIHLDANKDNFPGGHIGCYRVTLPCGRNITIFNVHLCSFKLKATDKELYKNLTELHRENLGDVRSQLIDKLRLAATDRARELLQIQRYVRLYGGPDVIITGDFNDVEGCYTIRALADAGFRSVYPKVGFGPMITFADDRMYFGIDHTLYRGGLIPLSLKRADRSGSDHYPIVTTFAIQCGK